MPLIQTLEAAVNDYTLLETEKESMYFAVDTRDLLRGDLVERINAYAKAIEKNIMLIDEVRRLENLEPLGIDFIQLNLSNVFHTPKTKEFYVPNTGQSFKLGGKPPTKKAGEENGEQQGNISP